MLVLLLNKFSCRTVRNNKQQAKWLSFRKLKTPQKTPLLKANFQSKNRV